MPRATGWRTKAGVGAIGTGLREWNYNGSTWVDLAAADINTFEELNADPTSSPVSGDRAIGLAAGAKTVLDCTLRLRHGPVDFGSTNIGDVVSPRMSTALAGNHTDDDVFVAYRVMKSNSQVEADTLYYGIIYSTTWAWHALIVGNNFGFTTAQDDFSGGVAPTKLNTGPGVAPGYNQSDSSGNPATANAILANIDTADLLLQFEHATNMANDQVSGLLESILLDFADYVVSTKPAAADFKEDFESGDRFDLINTTAGNHIRSSSVFKNGSWGLVLYATRPNVLRTGAWLNTAVDRSVSFTHHATADSSKFGGWVSPREQAAEGGLCIATGLPDDYVRIGIRSSKTPSPGLIGIWDGISSTTQTANINQDNWYWVEGQWTALNTITMRVYDLNGTQIGTDVTHTVDASSAFLDSGHWMAPGVWMDTAETANTRSVAFDDISFGRDDNPFGPVVTDLRLADSEVTAVKLGDKNVTAVYLGDTQVF